MGSRSLVVVLLGVAALSTASCATSTEWAAWRQHPTHFASSDHLVFSLHNRQGESPRVTRRDLDEARGQNWWGDAVTVSQAMIVTR